MSKVLSKSAVRKGALSALSARSGSGYFPPTVRDPRAPTERAPGQGSLLTADTARRFLLRRQQTLSLQPVCDPRSRATPPRPGTMERGTKCATEKMLHNDFQMKIRCETYQT